MTNRYDDILYLPHKQSDARQRMSRASRAAQFAPFAALVGYPDSHGVRADVQALYVCRNRADSAVVICRGGDGEHRQELSEILCRRMSGRRNHRACLRHLFAVCVSSAICQHRCLGNYAGLDLCRGDRIQYACACRDSEAVGSGCE